MCRGDHNPNHVAVYDLDYRLRVVQIQDGTANGLLQPDDQYLCIVPSAQTDPARGGRLHLHFEGDRTLAIILSKAFLLAGDTEITDSTITT